MTTPIDNSALDNSALPAANEIEVRAYAIYCARGCVDGHDVDDWIEAERQLLAEAGNRATDPGEKEPGAA